MTTSYKWDLMGRINNSRSDRLPRAGREFPEASKASYTGGLGGQILELSLAYCKPKTSPEL